MPADSAFDEATQRALEKLRIVAELAPDALVIVDRAGRILLANEAAEAMFGYGPRDLVGECIEILVPEGNRQAHVELRQRYGEQPRTRAMGAMRKLYGRKKDGTTFPIEISLRPVEADGVALICSGIRDVSDRVAIAEQLRAGEELFRMLVHQSTDGIFITDRAGRYEEVNPAGCEMLGYTREELLAMSIADIVSTAEVPRIADEIVKLERGEPVRSEWEFRRRDGSTFFGEVHARGLSDSRLLANVRDITSRRAIEDELRASKRFIEAVAHASPPVIYVFDLNEMALSYANRSLMGELGHTDFTGNVRLDHFKTIVTADELPHVDRVIGEWRALGDGERREDEYRLRDANGAMRWFLGRETVFARAADGTVRQVLGMLYDITERRRLEERLRQSEKLQAIGRLAGGVAHDFNNALTVIIGVTEVLLERLPPGDSVREDVTAVRDAAEQAASLTQQLLLFSRKAVLQPRVLDCNELVTRMSQMLRRVIGEDIVLSTTLDPSLWRVKADVSQIEQVIMNLALNARDAMPRGGRIAIETNDVVFTADDCREHPECTPGHFVQLVIRDTGTGMTSHVKTHLFEPFFTTKGAGRGTGLGLATVYGIVQQTGGFITVTSELEVGTTFNVFLPAIEHQETTVQPTSPTDGRLRGSETVLLVEDDDSVRHLTRMILQKYGYNVVEAPNGRAALRVSDEYAGAIELVLSDVIMPEMSGPDLVTAIVARRPGIRALLMSGYEEGLIAGGPYQASGPFISKPFRPVQLAAKVREILDGGD